MAATLVGATGRAGALCRFPYSLSLFPTFDIFLFNHKIWYNIFRYPVNVFFRGYRLAGAHSLEPGSGLDI